LSVISRSSLSLEEQQSLDCFMKANPTWKSLKHIAIIMDGNRRWAKERCLPSLLGHQEGSQRLKEIIRACSYLEIEALSTYAFSTENWKRSNEEVSYLMRLMADVLSQDLQEIARLNVKIKVIGDIHQVPTYLKQILEEAVHFTQANTGLCLQLAINYGGRAEIIQAVQSLAESVQKGELEPSSINEERLSHALLGASSGLSDPDLVIRTSGEQRLSNFLIWQTAYSELYFTSVPWPSFTVQELCIALDAYFDRQRRFGE